MELVLGVSLTLAAAVIALQTAVLLRVLRQHGLTILAHDDLRNRLTGLAQTLDALTASLRPAAAPQPALQPLQVGTPGPDFALPGLDGRERRLHELRGKPLVVLFFNPECGFCSDMAP